MVSSLGRVTIFENKKRKVNLKKYTNSLKNPLVWLGLFLLFFAVQNNYRDGEFHNVIRSDGSGYYAYLPAIFLYNDATYEQSNAVEKTYYLGNYNQAYLFKDAKGNTCNKYFPGIALLQAPFFAAATVTAWVIGSPVDGYSQPFQIFFLLGSLFYSLLGLWLFFLCLKRLFPQLEKQLPWFIVGVYLASTLFMYNTNTLGFTHHYSFCLFGLFTLLVLQIRDQGMSIAKLVGLGAVLGVITLVRPTNALVVLILPFLLQDAAHFTTFLKELFAQRMKFFLASCVGFMAILFLLFSVWKWQSGSWLVWSYKGEGFNFLHPKWLENLVGFRVGLLVHSPFLLLSLLGALLYFRKQTFQLTFWWLYFLSTSWVISAWWCWDYESTFGNRPFTEHLFFLVFPLLFLVEKKPKATLVFIAAFACLGVVRYREYVTGFMVDQRFTRSNYLKSMAFWVDYNKDRWRYPKSVPPFGKVINRAVLLEDGQEKRISPEEEFALTVEKTLTHPRTAERLYFTVEVEKRLEQPLGEVYLVIDAANQERTKMYYDAIEFFNDRFEGLKGWEKATFSGLIPDYFQEFDQVKIYIWNKRHNAFELRNVKITLDTYLQD